MSDRCVFCDALATWRNGLNELVCEDHELADWHDNDGSMWDRYEPGNEYERRQGRGGERR